MALIYVVEDDKNIQEIETFALANVGYEVKGFDSAMDFYEALNDTTPDLILLDIMLPDEDGLSIVKKLRTRQDTVLVPVIMVTAKTTEIDKVKGLDLGADDYITKPFHPAEVCARVKSAQWFPPTRWSWASISDSWMHACFAAIPVRLPAHGRRQAVQGGERIQR